MCARAGAVRRSEQERLSLLPLCLPPLILRAGMAYVWWSKLRQPPPPLTRLSCSREAMTSYGPAVCSRQRSGACASACWKAAHSVMSFATSSTTAGAAAAVADRPLPTSAWGGGGGACGAARQVCARGSSCARWEPGGGSVLWPVLDALSGVGVGVEAGARGTLHIGCVLADGAGGWIVAPLSSSACHCRLPLLHRLPHLVVPSPLLPPHSLAHTTPLPAAHVPRTPGLLKLPTATC